MAEVKDNLLQLDKVVSDLNKRLDENIDKIDRLSVVYNKFSKESASTPSQYVNVLNQTKVAVDQLTSSSVELTKEEQKLLKNKREINATIRSEIAKRKAQTAEIERSEKALARENAKLEASSNVYNKVQAKMNALSMEYKALATRKELGISLTDREAKRYDFLQGKIQTYDKTLKAVDASMGKYQRNVGNYAGAFNPLSNSINQLSREMPAFANSVQTGFMAISNNLPIFFDAMGGVIAQNKELQAQGKPTKSVFSQLASSVLSVGTALSVGVTLLTVYGKDIVEFFMNTSKAQENYVKNTEDVNATYTNQAATLSVVKEVINDTNSSQKQLNAAYKLAQKEGISLTAVEQARKGNLELLNSEIETSIDLSIKKAKADKLVQLIATQELENDKAKSQYLKDLTSISRQALVGLGFGGIALKQLIDEKEIKNIDDGVKAIEDYKKQLKALGLETLLDDDKTKKGAKEKIELNFKEIQSLYELKKARLESEKSKFVDNSNLEITNRIETRKKYSKILIDLAQLDYEQEKKVLQKKYNDDLVQNNLALKNKEISSKQHAVNLLDINSRYSNEVKKADVEISTKKRQILSDDLLFMSSILQKELKQIEQKNIKDTDAFKNQLDNFKKFEEAFKNQEKLLKDLKKWQDDYIKGFETDFISNSGFSKLFDLIENFNKLKDNGTATALAISEAFQEAFNTISKASQQNFDAEYSRLEQQKENDLLFAGESADARENIEREYESRRKEIQRREAEAQKRLAIFNIAVNTAQAIMSLWVKPGYPQAIPMMALVGALGAAQIAMVSSQQIPQFWKGTDNAPEGWAWTQEKGAEVITDRSGNVKSYGSNKGAELTYLNAGDKVYKSHEDYINKELMKNGIQPMGKSFNFVSRSNGLTAEDLNNGIADLKRAISQKENISINIDKTGFRTAVNGKEYLNNRLILKGRSV